MANLDVGVDAKLRLKFVTHNKSVSGYFTSHGTETIRQEGWMLTASSIYNMGINKCMYSVLAVYCSVAGWHVYWSPGSRNCSDLRPAQSQTRPEFISIDDHDLIVHLLNLGKEKLASLYSCLVVLSPQGQIEALIGKLPTKKRPLIFHILHFLLILTQKARDSKGISKLPQIQLILPYKISCIRGSLEIPLLSLVRENLCPQASGCWHPSVELDINILTYLFMR